MKETNFEGSRLNTGGGRGSTGVTVAAICGAVLIVFIMAGCFLTTLIMILDAIPFHAIFGH